MVTKRVLFIRPGETEWNKIERWQGHVSIPLNENGRAQAERLAQFIRPVGIEKLYSSDLRRAKETAEMLTTYNDSLKVQFDERLRERAMGEWQGMTNAEIRDWHPEQFAQLQDEPDSFVVPGGESREAVRARMRAAFDEIVTSHAETVAILSHSTAIKALIHDLIPDANIHDLTFKNMSVTTIARNGGWEITQLDDVTHLEGMQSVAFRELEEDA